MTGDFWGIVGIATGIASVLAGLFATAVTLWLRRADRPEPDWAFFNAQGAIAGVNEGLHATFAAVVGNAGDGSAFRLVASAQGCEATLQESANGSRFTEVPLMLPGARLLLRAKLAPGARWEDASFTLTWTASPTRQKKRESQRFALSELAPAPDTPTPTPHAGGDPGTPRSPRG